MTKEFSFSLLGDIGYLEHVVVQVSLAFQGVDVEDYLDNDNDVYYYLSDYFYYYYDYVMPNRGDIQLELTSPQGTTSILLPYRRRDSWPGNYTEWPFLSVHFWGEDPSGDWTLTVTNRGAVGTVEVSDLQFIFYGTSIRPEVISRIPSQCDEACARGCAAPGPEFCDSCRQYRNAETLECIESCPDDFVERSGYCYNASEPEPDCVPIELTDTPDTTTMNTTTIDTTTMDTATMNTTGSTPKASGGHLLLAVISVMLCLISWLF